MISKTSSKNTTCNTEVEIITWNSWFEINLKLINWNIKFNVKIVSSKSKCIFNLKQSSWSIETET